MGKHPIPLFSPENLQSNKYKGQFASFYVSWNYCFHIQNKIPFWRMGCGLWQCRKYTINVIIIEQGEIGKSIDMFEDPSVKTFNWENRAYLWFKGYIQLLLIETLIACHNITLISFYRSFRLSKRWEWLCYRKLKGLLDWPLMRLEMMNVLQEY